MPNHPPIALVVGAGDYIGAAIAKRFAAGGFQVCVGRRNFDKLQPLVNDISSAGGTVHPFALDARKEERIVEVFAEIEKNIGPLEIVVCNVGGNVKFPIRETTSRVFRKVWEMATLTSFLAGREAAKYMVPRGRGSIFFTGATASMRGGSGFSAFASAKFGTRALAQSMARELGPEGIHIAHLVVDAGVDTQWVRDRIRESDGEEGLANLHPDQLVRPEAIGEIYWQLHHQDRSCWTQELDIRPFMEPW
ncbi:MAG: SDR family NAD(P)-dependent oxidoreductase [Rhodospirillaceae bacterium]|jgi:NAD(P)-dependent dehydrogenase (short-subunit alcohol dehydrogenase family)|nr:SDR family NAD(P)-dependent oxidoreductase [Rhodospirillaceae bacterium]